jgi:Fur family ferric uptake transcriptional regulator
MGIAIYDAMRLSLVIRLLRLIFILPDLGITLAGVTRGRIEDAPDWSEHAHAVLASAGLRRGGARERIIELLAREPCALSAIEIEDALRATGGRIGRATVYRVLELLAEHGLVERVAVDQGGSRFERRLPGGEHHHHLICENCGRLVAFDDPQLERAIDQVSERLGVRVETHEVVLRGACEDCGD